MNSNWSDPALNDLLVSAEPSTSGTDIDYKSFSPIILDLFTDSRNILSEKFEQGLGLTSTALKRYSGPTLEKWSEITLKLVIMSLRDKYSDASIEWGKGYIQSDYDGCSDERLDQHILVNGKFAYLQEDRAWIDKPFYTLKRAVIRNMMISCESKMSAAVKFGVVAYAIDIKQEIINTCDLCQGYGDRIDMFSITGRRRNKKVNGKKVNWYETGFVDATVLKYIDYVYKTLEDAILA
jgi:hypothetical protein